MDHQKNQMNKILQSKMTHQNKMIQKKNLLQMKNKIHQMAKNLLMKYLLMKNPLDMSHLKKNLRKGNLQYQSRNLLS